MAFLTLTPNGGGSPTTISVIVSDPPREEPREIGSLARAFGGSVHDSRRARVREWRGVKVIVTTSAAASLRTLLQGTQPLTANGDMTGSSVPVFCTSPETDYLIPGLVRLSWDMWANT